MTKEQQDKLKSAIKENFHVNKQGEVELSKELQDAVAGGLNPEAEEGEDDIVLNFYRCGKPVIK